MSEEFFMKKPCKHCPFRTDVHPFLHPERAYEIAAAAEDPYNTFPCHKTTTFDEDDHGSFLVERESEKECAGFLTLRARLTSDGVPENFEPSWDLIYEYACDMADAYEAASNR